LEGSFFFWGQQSGYYVVLRRGALLFNLDLAIRRRKPIIMEQSVNLTDADVNVGRAARKGGSVLRRLLMLAPPRITNSVFHLPQLIGQTSMGCAQSRFS
jgi:hypothetical protein